MFRELAASDLPTPAALGAVRPENALLEGYASRGKLVCQGIAPFAITPTHGQKRGLWRHAEGHRRATDGSDALTTGAHYRRSLQALITGAHYRASSTTMIHLCEGTLCETRENLRFAKICVVHTSALCDIV